MVVTRRAPAPPVPTSRTNSSQPIPRVNSKAPHETVSTPVSSPLANGATTEDLNRKLDELQTKSNNVPDSPSKKGKPKSKGKQKKGGKKSSRRSPNFIELLTRVFLLWFTIYSLSVCPTDEELKSPICRGLSQYRRLVLEPYVLPPIQHVLAHPSVAPYVDRAQPYVDGFIRTAKPIALRTRSEWNSRVVPQWNKRVVPQWNKRVVPLWDKYAVPQMGRVEKQLDPYLQRVSQEYERRLGPHIRVAMFNLQKWQRQAQPYFILAANKTYDGYQRAKPYAIPLWQRFRLLFSQFSRFLAIQRHQLVDPHVKRIWERVIELSGGKPKVSADIRSTVKTPVPKVARSLSSISSVLPPTLLSKASGVVVDSTSLVLPDVVSSSKLPSTAVTPSERLPETIQPTPSASVLDDAISTLSSSSSSAIATSADDTASTISAVLVAPASGGSSVVSPLSDSAIPPVPSTMEKSILSPIVSVTSDLGSPAQSLENAPASISFHASLVDKAASEALFTASSVTDEVRSSASAIGQDAVTEASTVTSSAFSAAVPSGSAQSPEDEDLDLGAFYAELGLGDDLLTKEDPNGAKTAPPPVYTETEEEKAEKRRLREIETAKKRADITGRHSKWEEQLEEKIATNRKVLRKALVALRKVAVGELKESEEIRQEIEFLVQEAEKYLKGAEKYMVNLKREPRKEDEKKGMWERVVERVDAKFGERLSQTEAVVNGWYNSVLNRELEEVRKVADEVRDIADRAQADIGLDYAWLDDVTYMDWQRYHALSGRSENFTDLAVSIQNGTHPSPPINPVLDAIADLQAEVQDVVVGFETRLRRIKRNGERAFGGAQEGSDAESDVTHPSGETVSILPIGEGSHRDLEEGESLADIPSIVIGRSKEEVMDALNRVAEAEGRATSTPEDKSQEPEEVIENLAHEVEEQSNVASSPAHEEL